MDFKNTQRILHIIIEKKISRYTILICTFDIDYQCLLYNTRVQESATIYDADVNVTIRLNI